MQTRRRREAGAVREEEAGLARRRAPTISSLRRFSAFPTSVVAFLFTASTISSPTHAHRPVATEVRTGPSFPL
jgi:hypothetical protein